MLMIPRHSFKAIDICRNSRLKAPNTVEFAYSELLYKKYSSTVNSEQLPSSY